MTYNNIITMAKKSIINLMTSMLLVALLPLASCSNDESQGADPVMPPAAVSGIEAVTDVFTIGQLDEENEANTRSQFVWDVDQQKYIFSWETGDHLAIYSTQNVRADYHLEAGVNSASATFDGGGFELATGATYYGFSPFNVTSDATIGNKETRRDKILMNYNGQMQKGNDDCRHLGAFDYQAAAAVAGAGNYAKMHYKHLGSVVRFFLTLPSDEKAKSVTFTKLTLTDYNATDPSKKLFNQPMQVLDLTQSKGTTIDDYQPYLESADIVGEQPAPFSISLRDSEGTENSGITINKTDNKTLVVHVFIPALELKGQVMKAVLETKEATKKYYITFNATNFIGGKYYNLTRTLIPSGTIDIRLKVNPNWQLGDTQPKTRAQGDPGYDKDVHAPKYLYPYIVLEGVTEGSAFHAFSEIETAPTDWTQDKDGVYVYNKPLSYSYTGNATAGRVYAIASDYQLTLSAYNENDLKGLSYSIPSDKSQDYLRNLYSTPLVTSAEVPFTGTVVGFEGGTPSADVTLYHVAAKVDVQWNSATQLPTANSFVSVNDVKNTGLYYFKPTENATNATGSYTVSEPITPGTMYNGRQVFYLPQFATPAYNTTYNIKVGGEVPPTPDNSDNVTFTPSTTNGWTSWLKANINK